MRNCHLACILCSLQPHRAETSECSGKTTTIAREGIEFILWDQLGHGYSRLPGKGSSQVIHEKQRATQLELGSMNRDLNP
jgi:hypothetical protein